MICDDFEPYQTVNCFVADRDGQIAISEGYFHDENGLYMAGQSVGHGNFYFLNYGHLFGPEVFLSLCDDLYEYSYSHIFSFDHYD